MPAEETNQTIIGFMPKVNRMRLKSWGVLAGLIAIIVVVIIVLTARGTIGGQSAAHLLYTDSNSGTVALTDASDKVLSKNTFAAGALYSFEAAAPGGGILLSTGAGGSSESYVFIDNNGQPKNLAASAVTTLNNAILLDTLHQVYFTSQDTVAFVTCPAGGSCQLETLNIFSGKTSSIIDTGVKTATGLVPVYLLGLSQTRTIAYLRIIGSNKLSNSTGAIYQVDLKSRKVVQSTDFSSTIDYSASLSPDAQQVAYRTGGYGTELDIHILNLLSKKDSKIKWIGSEIGSQPGGLMWSPDSTKVLITDLNIAPPPGSPAISKTLTVGYLDSLKMKITSLKTISDLSHNTVTAQGWLDNKDVVYQTAASSKDYDFTNSTYTTTKQNITSKNTTSIQSYGSLSHVIYW